jgi:hypothetical protein
VQTEEATVSHAAYFIFGWFVGGTCGVLLMAVLFYARGEDERRKERRDDEHE